MLQQTRTVKWMQGCGFVSGAATKKQVTHPCYGEWALNQYQPRQTPGKLHNLFLKTFEGLPPYDFC